MKLTGIQIILLFLHLLGAINLLHAQQLNNQWRFGNNRGINFNTTPPTAVNTSAIGTSEGCASVADPISGQLLFYTDGVTVWNSTNVVMQNGSGLMGGSTFLPSSTTAAIICPRPGNSQQYYIFTIDEQGSTNGLRFSVVDMSLQGGLGAVVAGQKNILLYNTLSEKLQIIPHSNGTSLWVLTHSLPNSFVAFLVDTAGVSQLPVVSTLGNAHLQSWGHMKISKQFDRLAMGNSDESRIELFDFDWCTGVVSNFRNFLFSFTPSSIYGIEFSPDGSRLYVTNISYVVQYNLQAGSIAAIQTSGIIVGGTGLTQLSAVQLGPDNRIYVAGNNSVDRIDSPNALGIACGYVSSPITNLGNGSFGLPNWVYSTGDLPFNNVLNAIVFEDSCIESGSILSLLDTTGITQVYWDMGDSNSATNQQVGFQVTRNFSTTGTFNIIALLDKSCGSLDTLRLTVNIISCTSTNLSDITITGDTCNVQQALQFSANGYSAAPSYFWHFGDPASGTNDTVTVWSANDTVGHVFSGPGTYTVCLRFTHPGESPHEICRTVTVGNCCLFGLDDLRLCINDSSGILLSRGNADSVRWILGENDTTLTGNAAFVPMLGEPGRYPLRAVIYRSSCNIDTLEASLNWVDCDLSRCRMFAPTAFTPQGDGINDAFRPILSCETVFYEFRVYNRWGEEVFRTLDSNTGWNGQVKGQDAEQGVYQFVLFYRLEVGETRMGSGPIKLLR